MILPKWDFSEKLTQKLTPTRKNKLDRVLSLPSFLYGLPDNLGGLADTLLVRMVLAYLAKVCRSLWGCRPGTPYRSENFFR